jgi:hypothetical protein
MMIINGKKTASLDPVDALSSRLDFYLGLYSEPIIDKLLGPGVTIIGSSKPVERYILQEQMVLSIATGEDFLGILKTLKSEVLYVVHGPADYKAMNARALNTPGIEVRIGWPRLSQGGMRELEKVVEKRRDLKAICLGDFNNIRSSPKIWLEKWKEAKLEESQTPGPFDKQDLRREVTVHDIRRLRDFAVKNDVSIVTGAGLSTKGVLYEMAALGHRDAEIHIWKVRDGHELEVLPDSIYVQAMTWDLVLDYDNRSYSLREEAKRRMKVAGSEASAPLPLTPKDKTIIDAMWDEGYMKLSVIEKAADLPHSTVAQRVKALQRKDKGEWIFKASDDYYFVNQYNKREWIK